MLWLSLTLGLFSLLVRSVKVPWFLPIPLGQGGKGGFPSRWCWGCVLGGSGLAEPGEGC